MKCINCGTVFETEVCPSCGLSQKYNNVLYRYEERQAARQERTRGGADKTREYKPHGKKKKKSGKGKWWILPLVIILLLFIFGVSSCGESDNDETVMASNSSTPKATEEPEITRDNVVTQAIVADYADLRREPDAYRGKYVTVTAQLSQIIESGSSIYYFGRTDKDGYGWYLGDEFCFVDKRVDDTTKLLEGDIVTVYGAFDNVINFKRALTGTNAEIPTINMLYVDILNVPTDGKEVINGKIVESKMTASEPGVLETDEFKVRYISHSLLTDAATGTPYLDVIFEFEHYGDSPISYNAKAYCKAFQGGVEVEKTYYTNEESEEAYTEVMANTPIKVNDTFELKNADEPVYIEMTEFISRGEPKMEMTLNLK